MANDRWDDDDVYRSRRYGNDEDYERNFRREREPWGRGDYPARRYESTPVLGMDLGGEPRSRGDWRRFDESGGRSTRGYTRDTDWSNERGWNTQRAGGERGLWERTKDEVRSWMGDTDAEHRREADHRGRGPRGYTRSDERIREDVSDWLMEDRYVDASEIDVSVASGEVTLAGTVDSREMKRRAEDIAASALGVKDVRNSLRVRSSSSYGTRTGETAGSVTGTSTTVGTETSSSGRTPSTSGEPRH